MNATNSSLLYLHVMRWCALLVLPLLACTGCQPSATNSTDATADALQQVDPQLVVARGGLRFVADSEVGLRIAREQQAPCLLFFTAEWCTFCHQMEATAFVDPAIAKLAKQFVCVLVDADHESTVCQQFKISGYPTVQFLSNDGRKLHRLVGRQSTPQLAAGMNAALQRLAWLDNGETSRR